MTQTRTWLIRTKQNKILGPVSKEKIIELVNSGSLTDDDELCSGNGYWFWVKEKELLEKYVLGNTPQGFNPVAEADTSLANVGAKAVEPESFEAPVNQPVSPEVAVPESGEEPTLFPEEDDLDYPEEITPSKAEASNSLLDEILDIKPPTQEKKEAPISVSSSDESDEEILLPDEDDLEFPDIAPPGEAPVVEDIQIEKPSSSEELVVAQDDEPLVLPEEDDLEYPDMSPSEPKVEAPAVSEDIDDILSSEKAEIESLEIPKIEEESPDSEETNLAEEVAEAPQEMPKPKKKKRKRKKKKSAPVKAPPKRNDRVMIYALVLVILVILYGVYFYYTSILGQSFVLKKYDPFFNEAQAQEKIESVKKKFH